MKAGEETEDGGLGLFPGKSQITGAGQTATEAHNRSQARPRTP